MASSTIPGISAAEARDITGSVFLTRKEAAVYLNIGERTLANHVHDGPKFYRLFGAVRYRLDDLDHWAMQQVA